VLRCLALALLLAPAASAATSAYDQAEAALADGDFKRAQSLASTAANSGDTDALLLKAETSLAIGDRAAAATALERAAKNLKPSQARVLEQRAQGLRQAASKQASQADQLASKPTKAPTAAPTPVPTTQPTVLPTMTALPTAAPTPDPVQARLEDEKRALEAERAKLAEERARLALETERRALEDERRQLQEERRRLAEERTAPTKKSASPSGLPMGGISLLWAWRQPDYTRDFAEISMPPMDLITKFRFEGAVLEAGIFATDLVLTVPTEGMDGKHNEYISVTAPWIAVGYDVMPWAPQIGQARAYLPLGVRFTLNYGGMKGETYLAPTISAHTGLGLRWRISRRFGLDFSGRWNVHVAGEAFDSDNGNQLRTLHGVLEPSMDGPELRLGGDFYLW
jgi:hypothetical protein